MTFDQWWTEQVAMVWFAWNDARRVLGEIEQNEPETTRLFASLGFQKSLLQDMREASDLFDCLRRNKRKAEVESCPRITEKRSQILIEKLHTTVRRIWFWVHIMQLDEAVRWSRHGLLFRAELIRNGLMAYDPTEWPDPFPRLYKLLPHRTPRRPIPRAPGGSSLPHIGPLTPRPPIEILKKKRRKK